MAILPYFAAGYKVSIDEIVAVAHSLGFKNTRRTSWALIATTCYELTIILGCDVLMILDKHDSEYYFICTRGSIHLGGFPWEEHKKDKEVKAKAQALGIRCDEFINLDHPKIP